VGSAEIDSRANSPLMPIVSVGWTAGVRSAGIATSKPGVKGRVEEQLTAKMRVERGVSTQEPQCSSSNGISFLSEQWRTASVIVLEELHR
jgi:hypothetical protein